MAAVTSTIPMMHNIRTNSILLTASEKQRSDLLQTISINLLFGGSLGLIA